MKFEDYKFMQLGGNCAYLGFQSDKKRIRGPMDNTIIFGVNCIKLLFNNKLYDFVKNTKFISKPRPKSFKLDCPVFSTFPNDTVRFVHNIPEGEKFFTNFKQRCENFNNFFKKVKTDDKYYFIITINQIFAELDTGKLKNNKLDEIIKFLRKTKLLDKTIFVGTRATKKEYKKLFNYYIKDINKYKQKVGNINYIEMLDVDIWPQSSKDTQLQFKKKISVLLTQLEQKNRLKKTNNKTHSSTYLGYNYFGI